MENNHLPDRFARGAIWGVALGAALTAGATLWSRLWGPGTPRTTPATAALAISDPAAALRTVVEAFAESPAAWRGVGRGRERRLDRAPSRNLA